MSRACPSALRFPRLRLAALIACLSSVVSPAFPQDAASLNPLKALGTAALESFVQKPLFDPARQLPPPPPPIVVDAAPPPPPPLEPPPALQLIGVVRGHGGDIAIVHQNGNEKTVALRTGDKLGSWIVTVRPPVGVRLSAGERTVDFAIFAKGAVGPGAVGQPPAPARPLTVGQGPRRPPDE